MDLFLEELGKLFRGKFPIVWGKEYYLINKKTKLIPCLLCHDKQILFRGKQYECPRCHDKGGDPEIHRNCYSLERFKLLSVYIHEDLELSHLDFVHIGDPLFKIQLAYTDLSTMEIYPGEYLSDDYESSMKEIENLDLKETMKIKEIQDSVAERSGNEKEREL